MDTDVVCKNTAQTLTMTAPHLTSDVVLELQEDRAGEFVAYVPHANCNGHSHCLCPSEPFERVKLFKSMRWHLSVPHARTANMVYVWWFGKVHETTLQSPWHTVCIGTGNLRWPRTGWTVGEVVEMPLKHSDEKVDVWHWRVVESTRYGWELKDEVSVDLGAVRKYASDMERLYEAMPQYDKYLEPWITAARESHMGPIPLCLFVRPDVCVNSLPRMFESTLQLARYSYHALQFSAMPASVVEWAELMGNMLTCLSRTSYYRFDAVPIHLKKKAFRDGDSTDQWLNALLFPDLTNAGFDCEDAALMMMHVFCVWQKLARAPELEQWLKGCEAPQLMRGVMDLCVKYEPLLTIGTIRIGADEFTYHVLVVLMDTHRWSELCAGKNTQCGKDAVPLLTCEGTEYLTCCKDFKRFEDEEKQFAQLYRRGSRKCVRVPYSFSVTPQAEVYGRMMCFIDKHTRMWNIMHQVFGEEKMSLGVGYQTLRQFVEHQNDQMRLQKFSVFEDEKMWQQLLTHVPRLGLLPRVDMHSTFADSAQPYLMQHARPQEWTWHRDEWEDEAAASGCELRARAARVLQGVRFVDFQKVPSTELHADALS